MSPHKTAIRGLRTARSRTLNSPNLTPVNNNESILQTSGPIASTLVVKGLHPASQEYHKGLHKYSIGFLNWHAASSKLKSSSIRRSEIDRILRRVRFSNTYVKFVPERNLPSSAWPSLKCGRKKGSGSFQDREKSLAVTEKAVDAAQTSILPKNADITESGLSDAKDGGATRCNPIGMESIDVLHMSPDTDEASDSLAPVEVRSALEQSIHSQKKEGDLRSQFDAGKWHTFLQPSSTTKKRDSAHELSLGEIGAENSHYGTENAAGARKVSAGTARASNPRDFVGTVKADAPPKGLRPTTGADSTFQVPLWYDRLPGRDNAFIALGSNIGDRLEHIEEACRQIDSEDDMRILRTSALYETEPMYVQAQDRFLNGVCEISTSLNPTLLLDRLQAIEQRLGRVKIIDKGPRNIDLDILLYGR